MALTKYYGVNEHLDSLLTIPKIHYHLHTPQDDNWNYKLKVSFTISSDNVRMLCYSVADKSRKKIFSQFKVFWKLK